VRHLPNLLCLVRLALAPFCALCIIDGNYQSALLLFFIAGLTDFLDGWLARKMNWNSQIGAYLDPLADKVLMAVTFIAMGVAGAAPWCLVGLIFGRDILILTGVALLYSRVKQRQFPPSMAGKVSTTIQIAAALVILMAKATWLAEWWIPVAITATTLGTLWSGLDYVKRGRTLLN
jgi:cardiolipin synthase